MKEYMENQQKAPSKDRYQVRPGKKSNLIKAMIIGIVFMGASFAGTVYADCAEIATNEDWHLSLGSPEQRPNFGEARMDRPSETAAAPNYREEDWYLSQGSPEQRPDFGGAQMDRPSETAAAPTYMDEDWYLSQGSPEQQSGFRGQGQEIAMGGQVVC